ncbi:MAG TPA: chalcone isomerase family protein [Steroidobacteraceae bacterium]|nr:chalcone isomerase family protein [Steroidobacteraceae bacterium]
MSMRAPGVRLPAWAGAAALLLSLCVTSPVTAADRECDGVSFPEHIHAGGQTLTLNGLGLRKATFLRIKVYVGALYVAHPTADASAILGSPDPVEIELAFVFRATAGQLRDAWEEGFQRSTHGNIAPLRSRITDLENRMTAVRSGQRVSFLRVPGVGIQFSLDGTLQGTIRGDDFATAFLAIWLGPSPPSPELRAGLLGGSCT